MNVSALHKSLVVVDGLVISNWSREVFEDMRAGGISAANCTCSVWDNFRDTMDNLVQWNKFFRENDDLILRVNTTADIARAKRENKVGIILGWQNISGIEDKIGFLQIFHDLGVRVIQLAYNTQNLVGTGCYESRDSGLSDFGREVVDEMNRIGMGIDLSHVGSKTSNDVIRHSVQPVCYSHTCPKALKEHPRNKTDEELRFMPAKGALSA
jgi:membrane dipeptidase